MFSLPLSPCPGALSAVTRRCGCLFHGPFTLRQLRAQTSLHAQSSCPHPHRTSCFIPGSTLVVLCFPVASPRLCLSSQRQLPPHPVLLTPCPMLHSASDPACPQLSALNLNLPDLCKGHWPLTIESHAALGSRGALLVLLAPASGAFSVL